MTTTKQKLKIIPGRGLTGRDIKNRLRNRTLEGQTFGDEAYMLNEEMDKYMKMSKTEQIAATRENSHKLRQLQREMEVATNKQKQREHEQEIERRVQEKMKEIGKEQLKQTTNG